MGNRWRNNGNSDRLYFLGSKITADGDCHHEIKRHVLLGRKAMTSLGSILKSRDITLPTKVCLVKATVFPVVMYGCESWTLRKTELLRIDAFELWCWRRLLRIPWTATRSNQSILKEINPDYSLEGLMTNLDSILKRRDITLPTKVHLVKAIVFPVVMYGCQRWSIKKAEGLRIDAFELWCWRRLLRVP